MSSSTPSVSTQIARRTASNVSTNLSANGKAVLASVTANVEKDDLVAIEVYGRRTRLTADRQDAQREMDQLNAKARDLKREFDEIGPSLVSTIDTKLDQKVADALKDAGYGKFVVNVELSNVGTAESKYDFTVKIQPEGDKSGYSEKHDRHVKLPFPAEAKKIIKQQATVADDIQECQTQLLRLKQDLSDSAMNSYREGVRAELAKFALLQQEGGQEVLEAMTHTKALPAA
jgi:hypothetical protein